MAKVGMYKQAQYDQGVQKVQSYIDNVAGLDIMHGADKTYLQSKLGQLGNKLKTVAAGDFSNQQLVSSVGGMASSLIKDQNIQNAVSSTAWYKKQNQELEEARKKGAAPSSHIWKFSQEADSWLNNDKVGQTFRARFNPYSGDPQKKALEAIKALHAKLQDLDIPFVIENGKITNRLAEVMQTKKITEVTPEMIHDAVAAVLNEDDYNHLSIEGAYRFKDITPDKLSELAVKDYTAQKNEALAEIEKLNEAKKVNIGDPDKIEIINNRIDAYRKLLGDPYEGIKGKLDNELESNLSNAKNNPDAVKGRLYQDAFIKQFSSAFKYRDEEIGFEDSPYEKVRQWKSDNVYKWTKFGEDKRQFGLTYGLSVKTLEEKMKENELKRLELYGDQGLTDWTTLGNDTENDDAAKVYAGLIDGYAAKQQGIKDKIVAAGYTPQQAEGFIASWNKNPKTYSGPAKLIGSLKEYARIGNLNDALMTKGDQIMSAASAKMMKDPAFKDVAALMNETVTIPNSVYSPKQGKWINNDLKINGKQLIADIQSGKISFKSDKAPAGQVYITFKDANGRTQEFSAAKYNLNPQMKTLLKYYDKYKSEVGRQYNDDLAPLVQEFIPRIKGVPGKKEGGIAPVVALNLSALITSADYQDIAADKDTNLEVASSYLSEENAKNTKVFVHNYGGDNYEVWLKNEKNPSVIQKLKVPREKIDKVFGPGYTQSFTDDQIRLKFGRGNTNTTGNPKISLLQTRFGDMPNIQRMDVTADLDEDLSAPGTFVPMINVKQKNGRYMNFAIPGKNKMQRLGYEQGVTQLNALNDDSLLALLKETYPRFDFSTLDIQ
jgi:hypothetical protein